MIISNNNPNDPRRSLKLRSHQKPTLPEGVP
jgi:hypothetical protein